MIYFDWYYLFLVVPALLVAVWAQANVSSTFHKYESFYNARGITGERAAREILDRNGLYDVRIELVSGKLSDHYDPKAGVIRLSESVYNSTSVASVGVAAHEAGHAVQYQQGYVPIKIRSAIIPVTQFGSSISIPLVLLGIFLSFQPLITAGIVLFAFVVVFQLVTLPVEYNASGRALKTIESYGLLQGDEIKGAKRVLNAAALTYVAALLVSLANLLRLIAIAGRRK